MNRFRANLTKSFLKNKITTPMDWLWMTHMVCWTDKSNRTLAESSSVLFFCIIQFFLVLLNISFSYLLNIVKLVQQISFGRWIHFQCELCIPLLLSIIQSFLISKKKIEMISMIHLATWRGSSTQRLQVPDIFTKKNSIPWKPVGYHKQHFIQVIQTLVCRRNNIFLLWLFSVDEKF